MARERIVKYSIVMEFSRDERLRPRERRLLWAFALVVILFGVLVEVRSAGLSRRMGDLGVFLRAGWAVRSDADLYSVTCDNKYHYCYPPLFAILMAPLADPPHGMDGAGWVPYPVSVAICYVLNLLCLALAVHWLASALEGAALDPATQSTGRGTRRWWYLRVAPVLALLPPIGHTLSRGQTNLLLLMLVCGWIASVIRGRSFTGGLFLAMAICLKIIPAFLLLHPIGRRDGRGLAGCAVGLLIGLVAVPTLALGPQRAASSYRDLFNVVLAPALGVGVDRSRDAELHGIIASNNQSFRAMIHGALHPGLDDRPRQAAASVELAHWVLAAALTLLTLVAARRRGEIRAWHEVVMIGSLIVVMLLASPVCHSHYFVLCVPLMMGLLVATWERNARNPITAGWCALAVVLIIANCLPHFHWHWSFNLRQCGFVGYSVLLLWAAGIAELTRGPRQAPRFRSEALAFP